MLLDGDRIVALLDWEQAELFARYTERTGIEVDAAAVAWWNVLASFKTAVMQVSGLRSFFEGRSDEPYRPTATVLRSLLDAVAPPDAPPHMGDQAYAVPTGHILDQHLHGARWLLDQVAAGWPGALRFLLDDNVRLEQLLVELGQNGATPVDDGPAPMPALAHVQLRTSPTLAEAVGTTRAQVAKALRHRVDADPVTRRPPSSSSGGPIA